jgi:AraC-like DNA-binding protein
MIMHDDLVILATTRMPECNIRINKHLIGYSTIQFMERGAVDVCYDNCEYSMRGAWFWPAHPGPCIRFFSGDEKPWFHRHIGFQGARIARWIADGWWLSEPQPAPPSRTPKQWGEFFDEIIQQSQRLDAWGKLRTLNLLEQLLLELAEARVAHPHQEPWLETVLQKMNIFSEDMSTHNRVRELDYEHLAREVGMSLPTLRRRFKAATGTTLHNYLLQNKVAHARRLLGETDLPVKTVASRLGYDNVYFFSRQFREIAGVPPGVYRRSRQA